MQTKNKKIVAREIIILFSVLLISLLFFLGNLLYNKFQSRHISEYIKQRIAVVNSIDSLQRSARLFINDNSIYKFLKAKNLTEKDEASFLSTYKNLDSAKLIYDFMLANNLTDLSESAFNKKYLSPSDIDNYLRIQNQLKLKESELSMIIAKQSAAQKNLITNNQMRQNMIWFFVILFSIVYLLRPSIKILSWSFRTLSSH